MPVRFELPGDSLESMRALPAAGRHEGIVMERDDSLPAGTMRVVYADGTTELLPIPKR